MLRTCDMDALSFVTTPTDVNLSASHALLMTASPPDPRFHGIDQYWLAHICS